MSKITTANKKAKAEGKIKGKKALTASAKKTKKASELKEETKPSIPNYEHCCTCKHYTKFPDGYGHMCKMTKKSCARKSTCEKYAYND